MCSEVGSLSILEICLTGFMQSYITARIEGIPISLFFYSDGSEPANAKTRQGGDASLDLRAEKMARIWRSIIRLLRYRVGW